MRVTNWRYQYQESKKKKKCLSIWEVFFLTEAETIESCIRKDKQSNEKRGKPLGLLNFYALSII